MSVYEIVKLVGTCVGLILATIVFFVVFFRGMAWIDLWIKAKTGLETSRTSLKSKRRRTGRSSSAPRLRTEKLVDVQKPNRFHERTTLRASVDGPRTQSRNGVVREQLANRKTRLYGPTEVAQTAFENPATNLQPTALHTKETDAISDPEPESKTPSRIATVHLMSGEIIERVSFCSKEKATKVCEGLAFVGIVLENDDGQISVVRESNIKLVTWKVS